MKQNKETPTIAEMSEVVAKYMGWEKKKISRQQYVWELNDFFQCYVGEENFDKDWNRLHEVWEKVREEPQELWDGGRIQSSILWETPLETLTALYNCIIFINQLKQQANGKHSNI